MYNYTFSLGPKGQVVIPAAMRKALDLKPKSRLDIRYDPIHKHIVLSPTDPIAAFKAARGSLSYLKGKTDLVQELLDTRAKEQ